MRFRRTIPIMMVSGAIGGAILGTFKVKMTAFAFQSVLTIPVFLPMVPYIISILVSFVIALTLTLMFGYQIVKSNAAV